MTPIEHKALTEFVASAHAHYGPRLIEIFVFGSRARGDAAIDSDVDLAVVLADGDWRFWAEKLHLSDLTHDALIECGLYIQAWPVRQCEWLAPDRHVNPRFVASIKRDARPVAEAA